MADSVIKPKTGIKEASLLGLATTGKTLYVQYTQGGIEAIDVNLAFAFASMAYVLGMRILSKYKAKNAE